MTHFSFKIASVKSYFSHCLKSTLQTNRDKYITLVITAYSVSL